jgi:hypothetical protein
MESWSAFLRQAQSSGTNHPQRSQIIIGRLLHVVREAEPGRTLIRASRVRV